MGNPLRQKIRENGLFLLLIGAFVVFLLPMVAMCFLALPAADDFSQMAKLREAMGSDWSLGNYIQNVWMLARETYFNIQGAFTIDVMIFLNPLGYNLSLYPVACLINFFSTLVSVLVLSRCVVKYFLHSTWKNTIYLWMLAIFLLTQFIPLEETFYWYAGFIAYNLPLCLFMLLAAALIRMQFRKEKRPLFAAAACLLGFLIGGTNYPLALFSCCTLAVVLGINVLAKNRRQTLWALPVFLFLAAGFFINVVAPGNQERIEWYEQMHPAKAVFESFYFALDHLASWLTKTPILFFTLLCIPLMVRILSKTAFRFRLPGLVSLLVYCLYATLFTPGLYAMGSGYIPERYMSMVYMLLTWLTLFTVFYWTGWLVKKLGIQSLDRPMKFGAALAACVALLVPLSTQTVQDTLLDMGSLAAAEDVVIGEGRAYHKDATRLLRHLETTTEEKVVISDTLPSTRTLHELVLTNGSWQLDGLSQFYDVEIVSE